jgi:hypothetical protein
LEDVPDGMKIAEFRMKTGCVLAETGHARLKRRTIERSDEK